MEALFSLNNHMFPVAQQLVENHFGWPVHAVSIIIPAFASL